MDASFTIRPMEKADLDEIVRIEQLSFKDGWNHDSFEFEIEKNAYSYPRVLEKAGQIVGYIIYWVIFERAEIASIAIDPAFRGQGLSHLLMDYSLQAVKDLGAETFLLEVRPSNTSARHLYESHGFVFLNRVENYYSDGEDALVLSLGL